MAEALSTGSMERMVTFLEQAAVMAADSAAEQLRQSKAKIEKIQQQLDEASAEACHWKKEASRISASLTEERRERRTSEDIIQKLVAEVVRLKALNDRYAAGQSASAADAHFVRIRSATMQDGCIESPVAGSSPKLGHSNHAMLPNVPRSLARIRTPYQSSGGCRNSPRERHWATKSDVSENANSPQPSVAFLRSESQKEEGRAAVEHEAAIYAVSSRAIFGACTTCTGSGCNHCAASVVAADHSRDQAKDVFPGMTGIEKPATLEKHYVVHRRGASQPPRADCFLSPHPPRSSSTVERTHNHGGRSVGNSPARAEAIPNAAQWDMVPGPGGELLNAIQASVMRNTKGSTQLRRHLSMELGSRNMCVPAVRSYDGDGEQCQ